LRPKKSDAAMQAMFLYQADFPWLSRSHQLFAQHVHAHG
jgi:hypothetical protein